MRVFLSLIPIAILCCDLWFQLVSQILAAQVLAKIQRLVVIHKLKKGSQWSYTLFLKIVILLTYFLNALETILLCACCVSCSLLACTQTELAFLTLICTSTMTRASLTMEYINIDREM